MAGVDIHRAGRANLADTPVAVRLPVIDMSVPRKICGYDKQGWKLMAQSIKCHVFEDERRRMTREKAEEFFENEDNFRW